MLKLAIVAVVMFLVGAYWLKGKLTKQDPNTKINVDEFIREDAKAAADLAKAKVADAKKYFDLNQK